MPNNQHLVNEESLPANWQPVDSTAVTPNAPKGAPAPPVPGAMPPYFIGSIAPQLQLPPDFANTEVASPRVPKYSLMPFGIQTSAFTNAAIQSTSTTTSKVVPSGTDTDFYQFIASNLVNAVQRTVLNFPQTAFITVADNGSNNATNVTLITDVANALPSLDANAHLQPAEQQYGVNKQTGTTYTMLDTDRAKMVSFTNSSSVAVTIPQAGASSHFISGWYSLIVNEGTNIVTLTPTTSTIDGAASLILNPDQGVILISDGTNYFTIRGTGGGFATSVAIKTSNYNVANSDGGKLLVANSSSAISFTLPASAPPAGFSIGIDNENTGTLTINPNGLNLDGSASSLSVYQNEGLLIASDGSNYYSVRGMLPPITGDVTFTGLVSKVVAIQTVAVSNTTPTNGQVLEYNSGATQWQPTTLPPALSVVLFVNNTPISYDKHFHINGADDGAAVWGVSINGTADGG